MNVWSRLERSFCCPPYWTKSGNWTLDQQLLEFVGRERLSIVARRGLRGELVFPIPYILSSMPTLVGYYRLLLGFSQKEFYRGPFSRFKRMESDGLLTKATGALLPLFCESLIESSWILVNGLSDLSQDTLRSLTLLTLGPQFRGSRNVNLGIEAIRTVFALMTPLKKGAHIFNLMRVW